MIFDFFPIYFYNKVVLLVLGEVDSLHGALKRQGGTLLQLRNAPLKILV